MTELAEDRIRELIVAGEMALGEQLSEASLAAQLGISKTPVREALLRLKLEGLIDIQPQRGTFVFSLSEAQVGDVCTFRELLEVAALRIGMERARDELVARLVANVDQMARAHQAEDWAAMPGLDQAFHDIIIGSAGNPYLEEAYELVGIKIRALRSRLPERNDRVEHCTDNHNKIVALVESGQVAAAQEALAVHIRDTRESYLEASQQARRVPVERRA